MCVYIYMDTKHTLKRDTCTCIVIALLFTIAKRWKYPWLDEWIKKMWYIHLMEYYTALNEKKILSHSTMWMNFENMNLIEISQTQKAKHYIISCTWSIYGDMLCGVLLRVQDLREARGVRLRDRREETARPPGTLPPAGPCGHRTEASGHPGAWLGSPPSLGSLCRQHGL